MTEQEAKIIWTPLHINLILHFHTTPIRPENYDAATVQKYIRDLLKDDLIEAVGDSFRTTGKGDFFVGKICCTPLPIATWE